MTPAQVAAELAAHHDTADVFTPYSLTDRVAAARLADMIPAGPSRDFLLHVATGNDNPPRKEIQP